MLRYNINTGVRKIKTKTAIIASTVVLGLGGATFGLALPFAAHAAGSGYGSQPGFGVSNSQTICAGHGAFGAFSGAAVPGEGSYVHNTLVAQDKEAGISLGSETGPTNSQLCGNPQN
jgi:hypothetical protein